MTTRSVHEPVPLPDNGEIARLIKLSRSFDTVKCFNCPFNCPVIIRLKADKRNLIILFSDQMDFSDKIVATLSEYLVERVLFMGLKKSIAINTLINVTSLGFELNQDDRAQKWRLNCD